MKALLDRHGYVLQLAVERRVHELEQSGKYPWRMHAYEVPVVVGQWTTRIDLVMENTEYRAYMACECKRSDPALAWFFARVPRLVSHVVTFDEFEGNGNQTHIRLDRLGRVGERPYHIGVVGKAGEKGDGSASGRDQIEQAVTQALKGASGLVNLLVQNHHPHVQGDVRRIIPAVVTTSRLFVTEDDISRGNLEDGRLLDNVSIEERPWLWYQYHASPHLLNDHAGDAEPWNPYQATVNESTRSVAIIRAGALEKFFAEWL